MTGQLFEFDTREECLEGHAIEELGSLKGKKTEIDNIDPYTAESVAGNQLRVRKLSVDEALRKYGHVNHHA